MVLFKTVPSHSDKGLWHQISVGWPATVSYIVNTHNNPLHEEKIDPYADSVFGTPEPGAQLMAQSILMN